MGINLSNQTLNKLQAYLQLFQGALQCFKLRASGDGLLPNVIFIFQELEDSEQR